MAPTKMTSRKIEDARHLLSWGVVQDVLEKQDTVLSQYKETLKKCVYDNIKQCEAWSATFLSDLVTMEMMIEQIKGLNDHMRDYMIQSFRQRHNSLTTDGGSSPGTPYGKHINVLRKRNHELSRDLRLEYSYLLDHLIQENLMSECDRESILAQNTTKRRNEAFITYLCTKFTTDDFKATVLPAMEKDDVNVDLLKTLEEDLEGTITTQDIFCSFCKMKGLGDLRKLSDTLFQQGSISGSVKYDLSKQSLPETTKWEILLKEVSEQKLLKALEKTQPHLAREFRQTSHPILQCWCAQLERVVEPNDDLDDNVFDVSSVQLCSLLSEEAGSDVGTDSRGSAGSSSKTPPWSSLNDSSSGSSKSSGALNFKNVITVKSSPNTLDAADTTHTSNIVTIPGSIPRASGHAGNTSPATKENNALQSNARSQQQICNERSQTDGPRVNPSFEQSEIERHMFEEKLGELVQRRHREQGYMREIFRLNRLIKKRDQLLSLKKAWNGIQERKEKLEMHRDQCQWKVESKKLAREIQAATYDLEKVVYEYDKAKQWADIQCVIS